MPEQRTLLEDVKPEGASWLLEMTLEDENGPISGGQLTTVTLTLRDRATGQVINSRQDVDVKPEVDGTGLLTHQFTAADGAIVDARRTLEDHEAAIAWTYGSGLGGSHRVAWWVAHAVTADVS